MFSTDNSGLFVRFHLVVANVCLLSALRYRPDPSVSFAHCGRSRIHRTSDFRAGYEPRVLCAQSFHTTTGAAVRF
jgi:hypothetical protein